MASGLAYGGAEGQTKKEIAQVLRYPLERETMEPAMGELLATMQIDANGRLMAVNNALWLQNELPVNQDWVDRMGRHYGAGVKWVDYQTDPDAARIKINQWVESKTNDRIKNLLAEPHVSERTKSVLVNTIFFKADWNWVFEKAETKVKPFKMADGKKVMTKLMNRRGEYQVMERDRVQAIRMPYRGGETEMIVFLPKSRKGLDKFENMLTDSSLESWLQELDNAARQDTILTLPKFKLDWKSDLVPVLESMGMAHPFDDFADFSSAKAIDPDSLDSNDAPIQIGAVIHQTFLDVEEKGTEAAAATAIVIIITSARKRPIPKPIIFRADRPFMFLIRDRRTKAILFMGRYVKPKAEDS